MTRQQVYALMIVIASAVTLGRILSAELLLEPSLYRDDKDPVDQRRDEEKKAPRRKWPATRPRPMPTFSSNDRSRWCTVRALVDEGTFVIGRRDPALKSPTNRYGDTGIVFEDGWQTVDKVMNPATGEFYSTKPPILPVLMAGECWLLKKTLGWTLTENTDEVVRVVVVTFNLLPWVLCLVLLARLLERLGTTDWGRLFVMATACFGTLLTPFLISINNHTLGACSAMAALYFAVEIIQDERKRQGWRFALCGFFACFTVCNELPAAVFALGLGALMLWRFPRQTMLWLLPAALVPAAAFLATNYLAISEWTPAYEKFGGPWYKYEGSHWGKPEAEQLGIDWAGRKETKAVYAFHVLLGHHGLFSLSPVLLLALAGMMASGACKRPGSDPPGRLHAPLAWLTLLLTVAVIGFYLVKSDNYGGWTNGPRWLLWLWPFWWLAMLPVADRLSASRVGRGVALALLAVSVMSANYSAWNPWRHPWIYRWMDWNGWIPY